MSKVLTFPLHKSVEGRYFMPKWLPCNAIYQGCDFIARGASDDEVIVRAVQHAEAKHSLSEIDWQILAKLCAAIREEEISAT